MKRAVILHGTGGSPTENWFPWLKTQLELVGYEVWVPQLPGAGRPNTRYYTDFLLSSKWDFQDNLLIGHSSGAVEILHLLQNLPKGTTVKTAVCVAAFSEYLAKEPKWENLTELFVEPFDFPTITSKAKTILFVHAADDPYCDPRKAEELADAVGGKYIELTSGGHFSAGKDPRYQTFPKLFGLLNERHLA